MNNIFKELSSYKIIPVIIIDDEKNSLPLANALIEGGLPVAEITFRTKAAGEAIRNIAKNFPNMLLGAGTVLTIDQVKFAVDAGSKFIVSPGLNPKVVEFCIQNNITITPGVATPTEIERALEFDLEVLKFFPAEALGGLNYLKAISAPFPKLKFIPTGGIDEKNILNYLQFSKVIACGGSLMVKSELITNKKFEEIKNLTLRALNIVKQINK